MRLTIEELHSIINEAAHVICNAATFNDLPDGFEVRVESSAIILTLPIHTTATLAVP